MEKYAVVVQSMDSDFIWCEYNPSTYSKEVAEKGAEDLNKDFERENSFKRKLYKAVPYSEVEKFWNTYGNEYPDEHYQVFIETENGDLVEFDKSFKSSSKAYTWCRVHSKEDGVKYVYRLTNKKYS